MRAAWCMLGFAAALAGGCSGLLGIEDLSGPRTGPSDAGAGDARPTDAFVAQLEISGVVRRPGSGQPALETEVDLLRPDGVVEESTSTAAADGAFMFEVQTRGSTVDRWVRIKGDPALDLVDQNIYFGHPLTDDQHLNVLMQTSGDLRNKALSVGVQNIGNSAFIIVTAYNAAGSPVAGIRVTIDKPTAIVRYPNASGDDATSASGQAYVFANPDAVISPATLSGTGTATVGPRTVLLVPNALTTLDLRP